jgi:hypothetical protein
MLASIVDLKQQVTLLKSQITSLQSKDLMRAHDVTSLQASNGMTFVNFPRLPVEIRMMIRKAFMHEPKIICVTKENVDWHEPKQINVYNPLFHVCRQLRNSVFSELGYGPKRHSRVLEISRDVSSITNTTSHIESTREIKSAKPLSSTLIRHGTSKWHVAVGFDMCYEWMYGSDIAAVLELFHDERMIMDIL